MKIPIFVILSCLLVLNTAAAEDKIIAVVNNEIITQKDLNDFVNFMRMQLAEENKGKNLEKKIDSLRGDMLDKLIEDRLILQEAKKSSIKLDQDRLKARVQEIKRRYESETAFQVALASQGLVEADIIQRIKEQMLMYVIIQAKVRDKIVINPDEVTEYYRKNKSELKFSPKREFTAISFSAENQAKEVSAKLKSGEKLQDLSDKYSFKVSQMTAQRGELRKDIEEAVFKLGPFEVSPAIKIASSFYVFRLDNIIPAREPALSEVQENIYRFISDKKMQESLAKWIDELRKKAFIKIL